MAGVDLGRYLFDRDLTLCILLMHSDGTIYHTFGGRTWRDPQSHLSMSALLTVLGRGLAEHARYDGAPDPPEGARWTVEHLPPLARRIASGDRPDCIHCHSVHDWEVATAVERETWRPESAWVFPDPIQIGLELDHDDQSRVVTVVPRSFAEQVGIEVGDRIVEIDGRPISTFGDVQRALEGTGREFRATILPAHPRPERLPIPKPATERDALTKRGTARSTRRQFELPPEDTIRVFGTLPPDWRVADPLVYSWRAMKWNLEPAPGFGGPQLDRDQLVNLGLPPSTFAFRVQYLVTWGPRAYTGRNAAKAGIRQGDVILAIDGRHDFESVDHYHSWFRLTRRVGETVPVELMRGREKRVVMLPVVGRE